MPHKTLKLPAGVLDRPVRGRLLRDRTLGGNTLLWHRQHEHSGAQRRSNELEVAYRGAGQVEASV
jgi:hypothetical protein